MITEEENKLLTQTNKGTPCGELMRRYWQPAALSQELTADKPLPVTILGEELILFREADGTPALIGRYCAHQGVDMIYGRVEADGLRCMYHGWLFDRCGRVVMRGEWLPEKERRWDVGQPAYPCREDRGVVFVWMASEEPAGTALAGLRADLLPNAYAKIADNANYLKKITDKNVQRPGARLVIPNMIVSPTEEGAELQWFVPTDDSSHAQFVLRFSRMPKLSSEPIDGAQTSLLEAIRSLGEQAAET